MLRQRRARNPLYDLDVAARRIFWVAALAGIIVFGSLMGAMFIGQQFLQNVLGYSPLDAGAAILPAAVFMVLAAPARPSSSSRTAPGSRCCSATSSACSASSRCSCSGRTAARTGRSASGYAFVGLGVGLAGTPASHSLTGSVPVRRAGMASGTADLQRDLGGAIMQSILGALLTAGYATAFAKQIAASPERQPGQHRRRDPAHEVVRQRGQHRHPVPAVRQADHHRGEDLVPRRRQLGLHGGHHRDPPRRGVGLLHVPERDDEIELLAEYHAEDTAQDAITPSG